MTEPSRRVFSEVDADNEGQFAAGDWALFSGISLVWGASFLLIAESLESLTPGMVTFGRVSLGAVTLLALRLLPPAQTLAGGWRPQTPSPDEVRSRPPPGCSPRSQTLAGGWRPQTPPPDEVRSRPPPGCSPRSQRIDPADRARIALLGLIWVGVPFTLFPLAQQWINSAVTGLLNGATPVLVALVSVVFVRVVPGRRQLVGLVLGFAGIVAISLGAAGEGSSEARGVLLVLAATLCYGFAFNIAPPLQAKYGAIVLMSSVLVVATVLVAPFALVDLGDNRWQGSSLLALGVLGSVGTGAAYWIMSSLVGRVGPIRASFITYVIPIVSLVLGVVFRNDTVTGLALIGTPITLVGAFLASRRAG